MGNPQDANAKTALTLSATLPVVLLFPVAPAAAAQDLGVRQIISDGLPKASCAVSNKTYLATAAKSLVGTDSSVGKLRDGTLWRSHRDGIVIYSENRKALKSNKATVKVNGSKILTHRLATSGGLQTSSGASVDVSSSTGRGNK